MILAVSMAFNASAQKKANRNSSKAKTENTQKFDEANDLAEYIKIVRTAAEEGDPQAMLLMGQVYYEGVEGIVERDYLLAAKWFQAAAQVEKPEATAYSAEAKAWLGLLYYNGLGVKRDINRAKDLFVRATKGGYDELISLFEEKSKEGDICAIKFMSECYNSGIGVPRNTTKALEYDRMAADAGCEEYYMPVGLYLYNNKRHGEAFEYFKKAALNGNIKAAYFYGLMLYDGDEGVEQDKVEGLKYLQMAANEGHVAANLKLGESYLYGNGLERDKEKGAQMIKVAAEKGNNKAMWILANCYRLGEGLPQNYQLASQWMALVASANKTAEYNQLITDLKAKNDPFYCYLKGLYEYNITGNYDEAMKQFQAVEKAKISEGKTLQGLVLTNKNYKKRDMKKAAKLFEKAAKENNATACYYLSYMMENGEGVKKDAKAALEMLTKAADGGCAVAQCRLADKYLNANGVEMNIEKAANYLLLAEKQHGLTPDAAKDLARLYESKLSCMPAVEDLAKHVEGLKKLKENNSIINMLASTKF